jgi:hypothetical protein
MMMVVVVMVMGECTTKVGGVNFHYPVFAYWFG